MSRKSQENPALDMTPMIDVVFELIIFFVVTLTEAQRKDETIELEDGRHGVVLTPDELPAQHMQIDVAKNGRISMGNVTLLPDEINRRVKEKKARISMGDREMEPAEITERVKARIDRYGHDFPVLIRADFATPHARVRDVMDACTKAGIWKISFMAVAEDKTNGTLRPRLFRKKK